MATTTLHIRNMVCNRCILVVRQLLEGLGLTPLHIELGKAIVQEELPPEAKAALNTALEAVGFELIDDRRSLLIERLRNAVIELAHYHDDGMRTNLSDYLSEKFHSDYSALSKLFSEMTGITLEKYYIAQRVERVKELLVYNELSLGQIADKLNYSSTHKIYSITSYIHSNYAQELSLDYISKKFFISPYYLSHQFKSVTGITPSEFRKRSDRKRRPLDQV